jgi:hypothetical protein
MGSVKDIIVDGPIAQKWHLAASPRAFGTDPWRVSGRFSVGDLKSKIPPLEIAMKNYILAMTAARYWESAASAGFTSCYIGMIDKSNRLVDTATLLQRGELSDIILMRTAFSPGEMRCGTKEADLIAYHEAIRRGEATKYVADAESIFRLGFPLGASTFEKIFTAVGKKDAYQTLATFDETVAQLDQIRAMPNVMENATLQDVLAKAGLDRIPNPGHMLEQPVLNFTTKFGLAGDEDITETEAAKRMGLTPTSYDFWKGLVRRNALHQIDWTADRGIVNIDGKVEAVVTEGKPIFTDFACTVDENRLMLEYEQNSTVFLVPSNKEIQRAIFRKSGIYAAIVTAKQQHGNDWLGHINSYATDAQIADATKESIWMMEQAIATVGNKLLGRNVFEAKPLESWVESFLPYASVKQRGEPQTVRN